MTEHSLIHRHTLHHITERLLILRLKITCTRPIAMAFKQYRIPAEIYISLFLVHNVGRTDRYKERICVLTNTHHEIGATQSFLTSSSPQLGSNNTSREETQLLRQASKLNKIERYQQENILSIDYLTGPCLSQRQHMSIVHGMQGVQLREREGTTSFSRSSAACLYDTLIRGRLYRLQQSVDFPIGYRAYHIVLRMSVKASRQAQLWLVILRNSFHRHTSLALGGCSFIQLIICRGFMHR